MARSFPVITFSVRVRGGKELAAFLSPNRQRALRRRISRNATKEMAETYLDALRKAMWIGDAEGPALAASTSKRKGHSKPWVDTTDMLGGIMVWRVGDRWFAGMPPNTPNRKGMDMSVIAQYLEGKGPQLSTRHKYIQPRPIFMPTLHHLQQDSAFTEGILERHTAKEFKKEMKRAR